MIPGTVSERLAGALADRYTIERELGAGGMATVYLARDLKHDRQVALKVLRQELTAALGAERFHREIQIAAKLQHPNILPLLDSGEAAGLLYYTMPYVDGQSLRERLAREGALPVPDAVRIVRDVVDALTEAHAHGVVHRDIKPENIMLRGRHALVADFGVAKAVSEATGRQTLTTAGVALGTPAYMAPEQASADPHLDHRVDIYAVGAVAYELLTGRPVFMGTTPQMVLSAHVTDAPQPITKFREAVPRALEALVLRCLAKQPADRWQSAEELLAQLEALATPSGGTTPTDTAPIQAAAARRRRLVAGTLIGVVVVIAAVATVSVRSGRSPRHVSVTLGERTQLTFSGNVLAPQITEDGKQLAYFTRTCTPEDCTYALEVQDVGSAAAHAVLDRLTTAWWIHWSPDRRNLLAWGTVRGRLGVYLVSSLGGTPRFVVSEPWVDFLAGGDSLLVGDFLTEADTLFWLRVQGLDGATRDSIPVKVREAARAATGFVVPGTRWIGAMVAQKNNFLIQIQDRRGRVADRLLTKCFYAGAISHDAVWMGCLVPGSLEGGVQPLLVIRIGIDSASGRLSPHPDTMFSGRLTAISVTADGASFVADQGTFEHSAWALDLASALRGRFLEPQRVLRSSTPFQASLSPDGTRLLLLRSFPAGAGRTENRISILPATSGAEVPLPTSVPPLAAWWADDDRIEVESQTSHGRRLNLVDVRSDSVVRYLDLADSLIGGSEILPDGWVYIAFTRDRLVTVRHGSSHEERAPIGLREVLQVTTDVAGRIFVVGADAAGGDTVVALEAPMDGSPWRVWARLNAPAGGLVSVAPGGGLRMIVSPTQRTVSIYDVPKPGDVRLLGTIPRPVDALVPNRTWRRVVVETDDYYGDAWMSKVLRP